ncbi:hypothetical protein VTJ83DRAFT_2753 [Remersonia thermophila]|uniref:Uncharacterized protein n=1 Tax=Remersonia thermophila TaxID=72144 RepID=A0ABR4DM72_9PEZI
MPSDYSDPLGLGDDRKCQVADCPKKHAYRRHGNRKVYSRYCADHTCAVTYPEEEGTHCRTARDPNERYCPESPLRRARLPQDGRVRPQVQRVHPLVLLPAPLLGARLHRPRDRPRPAGLRGALPALLHALVLPPSLPPPQRPPRRRLPRPLQRPPLPRPRLRPLGLGPLLRRPPLRRRDLHRRPRLVPGPRRGLPLPPLPRPRLRQRRPLPGPPLLLLLLLLLVVPLHAPHLPLPVLPRPAPQRGPRLLRRPRLRRPRLPRRGRRPGQGGKYCGRHACVVDGCTRARLSAAPASGGGGGGSPMLAAGEDRDRCAAHSRFRDRRTVSLGEADAPSLDWDELRGRFNRDRDRRGSTSGGGGNGSGGGGGSKWKRMSEDLEKLRRRERDAEAAGAGNGSGSGNGRPSTAERRRREDEWERLRQDLEDCEGLGRRRTGRD